jgi:hypothetical protein
MKLIKILILVLSFTIAFCYPKEHTSKYYEVHIPLGVDPGSILSFIDKTHEYYLAFFSQKIINTAPIYLYADYSDYCVAENIQPGTLGHIASNFTFTNEKVAIPLKNPYSTDWKRVLIHEMAHQFINRAYALDIHSSKDLYDKLPKEITKLPSVPQWLHEGIATYMESCYTDNTFSHGGKINREKLIILQKQIKSGVPVLGNLFKASLSHSMSGAEYPAAWGVMYWFMHDRNIIKQNRKRKLLLRCLNGCKEGFTNSEYDWKAGYLQKLITSDSAIEFLIAIKCWKPIMEEAALKEFIFSLKKHGQGTIKKWKTQWEKWILKLDPTDPYGGLLNIYQKTVQISNTSDEITLNDGQIITCNIIAIMPRGFLTITKGKQEFYERPMVKSYNKHKSNAPTTLYGIEQRAANLRISGLSKPNRITGQKTPKGQDALPK